MTTHARQILVLADPGDRAATQVIACLRRRGVEPVVATGMELALAGWEHRITRHGGARTRLSLQGATALDQDDIGVVLSRVALAPPIQFDRAPAADRVYAFQEIQALLLSFLSGLSCPVFNPPHPSGLTGRPLRHRDWMALAAKAGMAVWEGTRAPRITSSPIWIDGRVLDGTVDSSVARVLQQLAITSGQTLFRAFMTEGSDGPLLASATHMPELSAAEAELVARHLHHCASAERGTARLVNANQERGAA